MFNKDKIRKRKVKHVCFSVARKYREAMHDGFVPAHNVAPFIKEWLSGREYDTIPGTSVYKAKYSSLIRFAIHNDLESLGIHDTLTLREKRAVAIFLRKLDDRMRAYTADNMGLTNSQLEEWSFKREYINKAFSRKSLDRLWGFCYYRASEAKKLYEHTPDDFTL